MAWCQLSDVQWDQIRRRQKGGRPVAMPATVSKAYSGFSGPGILGSNCDDMAAPVSVGDACGSGNAVGCCWSYGGPCSPSSMTNRNSAGVNAFWMLRTGEKGGPKVGPTKCGKGTTWMVLVDGAGTPLGAYLGSASPAKVRLLEATLNTVAVGRPGQRGRPRKRPDRLIADRAYDSNAARALLVRRGIEPIIPAQSNSRRATHQNGHRLRRYRHRWIVERTIGWLGNFRCLTVRYEWLLETYSGFFI